MVSDIKQCVNPFCTTSESRANEKKKFHHLSLTKYSQKHHTHSTIVGFSQCIAVKPQTDKTLAKNVFQGSQDKTKEESESS